jgi:hypothetical protein
MNFCRISPIAATSNRAEVSQCSLWNLSDETPRRFAEFSKNSDMIAFPMFALRLEKNFWPLD